MRWALEISMPWGFMASTAAAENVDAGRIDVNAAGRVAARKTVRANIVVDGWESEGRRATADRQSLEASSGARHWPNSKSPLVFTPVNNACLDIFSASST